MERSRALAAASLLLFVFLSSTSIAPPSRPLKIFESTGLPEKQAKFGSLDTRERGITAVMEKVDGETLRLVRRLKSGASSRVAEEAAADDAPAPASTTAGLEAPGGENNGKGWDRIREVANNPQVGGEASTSAARALSLVPSDATDRRGSSADRHAIAEAPKQLFLPHLNLENRFLVSSQTAGHYGGWLLKRGSHMKVWRKRWFTVENECILYRKEPGAFEIRGSIPLCCVRNIFRTDNVKSKAKYENACICIKTDWRTYVLVAETALEARQWNFYLFRVWREVVTKARQTTHKIQNISSSDLIEETRLDPAGNDDEEGVGEAVRNDVSTANDLFVSQLKQADATRSIVVRRLWKLAYRLVVLNKSVVFAKDVAEMYKNQSDEVSRQRRGDTQTQRRAQETIRLLKKTLAKVNGLYEKEILRREAEEQVVAKLRLELMRARDVIAEKDGEIEGKDKENRRLEEDVMEYQSQVEQYYTQIKQSLPGWMAGVVADGNREGARAGVRRLTEK